MTAFHKSRDKEDGEIVTQEHKVKEDEDAKIFMMINPQKMKTPLRRCRRSRKH
jgi:hypothetical protein